MTKGPFGPSGAESAADWAAINDICDQYETAILKNALPAISEQMAAVPEKLRGDLVQELSGLVAELSQKLKAESAGKGACDGEVWFREGSVLNRFELIKYLGSGGFGFVFLANDRQLGRPIALKIARSEIVADRRLRDLFLREVKTARSLEHPNLAKILDSGELVDATFVVSEYEPGQSLKQVIADSKSPLDCRWSASTVRDIAGGIQHAHLAGVVHCDLNPGNVIVDDPSGTAPKVVDFGIAKVVGEPSELSQTGVLFGTPGFTAPEQAAGRRSSVDERTDVYGLGAVLYACLTGNGPFHADTTLETLAQVLRDEVKEPRLGRADIPPDLQAVCLRCLEKNPAKRFQTVQSLAEELDRFLLGRPTLTRPPSVLARVGRWARKKPVTATLTLAVTLSASVGVGFAIWHDASLRAVNDDLTTAVGKLGKANEDLKSQQLAIIARARKDRLEAYASDIQHASMLLQTGDFTAFRNRLDRWQPAVGEEDIRGFEWHYLSKQGEPEPVAPLWSGSQAIYGVAYSPKGDRIALTGADRMLHLVDVKSGKEIQAPRLHPAEPSWIDYSQSRVIVTACGDGVARIWNIDGGPAVELRGHKGKLLSVSLSPDGRFLATGGFDKRLLVWDLSKSPPEFQEVGNTGSHITALAWDRRGNRVYSGHGEGGEVAHWDLKSGTNNRVSKIYSGPVKAIFTENSDDIGVVFKIGVFDKLNSGGNRQSSDQAQSALQVGLDRINGASVSPDQGLLALARDGRVEVWDLKRKEQASYFRGQPGKEWSVAFSPDGKTIACGGADGALRLWAIGRKKTSKGHRSLAVSASFPAVGFDDTSSIVNWSCQEKHGMYATSIEALETNNAAKFKILPDGASFKATPDGRVVTVLPTGEVAIFADEKRQTYIGRVDPMQLGRQIGWVVPSDCSWLATHVRNCITVVRFSGGSRTFTIPVLALSGKMAAGVSNLFAISYPAEKKLLVWNADTGDKCLELDFESNTWDVKISPNGKKIAIGVSGTVRIIDLESKKEELRLAFSSPEHLVGAALAFSPNGRTLATTNIDGNVNFWQVETGRMLLAVKTHDKPVLDVIFSPDGMQLASTGFSGVHNGQVELIVVDASPSNLYKH